MKVIYGHEFNTSSEGGYDLLLKTMSTDIASVILSLKLMKMFSSVTGKKGEYAINKPVLRKVWSFILKLIKNTVNTYKFVLVTMHVIPLHS